MPPNDTEQDARPPVAPPPTRIQPFTPFGDDFLGGTLLARGGYAEIFSVLRRSDIGTPVALKLLREDRDTPTRQRALLEEAKVLSSLPKHPAFTPIYASGFLTDLNTTYFTMELLHGATLREALRQRERPFYPSEVVTFGAILADALGELHDRAYAHADVTPKNVFVTRPIQHVTLSQVVNGEAPQPIDPTLVSGVRLIDVGAAMSSTAPGSELRGIGTPGYVEPERGRIGSSYTGDVFSLGVILFEMLTLEHPFDGGLATRPAPPLRDFLPDAPESLERVIAAMLELDPSKRPATGHDAHALLTSVIPDVDVAPMTVPTFSPHLRPVHDSLPGFPTDQADDP